VNRLKQIRKKMGLKQVELGKKSGINRSTIGMYEGGWSTPRRETARKLAKALGKKIEDIFPGKIIRD